MYTSRQNTNAVIRNSDGMIVGPENVAEWAEYQSWLASGNSPLPSPVDPVHVPQQVPMWAVRTVLQNDGLFDEAQSLVNSSTNNALKNVWEYGNYADRNSGSIAALGTALGLSSAQIDQMFIDANQITI